MSNVCEVATSHTLLTFKNNDLLVYFVGGACHPMTSCLANSYLTLRTMACLHNICQSCVMTLFLASWKYQNLKVRATLKIQLKTSKNFADHNFSLEHDTKILTTYSDRSNRPLSNHTLRCPVPSKITKIA